MIYSSTDRKGVQWVGLKTTEMNWIFREQSTDDWGIDAHLEVVAEGKVTGRLIAVQIKSGKSWFSEETEEAFIFRGELRHLSYWQNHSLPVIIILYNTDTKQGFWQIVRNDKITVFEKGWKIEVPKSNMYGTSSSVELSRYALPENEYRMKWDDVASLFNGFSKGFTQLQSRASLYYASLFGATKEILILAYYIDSDLLDILAIISKTVSVKMITSINVNESFSRISDHFPNFFIKSLSGLHARAILIDSTFLVISSNFSVNSFKSKVEYDYATTDFEQVKMYKEYFSIVWK
jgi:hypothetical protein